MIKGFTGPQDPHLRDKKDVWLWTHLPDSSSMRKQQAYEVVVTDCQLMDFSNGSRYSWEIHISVKIV